MGCNGFSDTCLLPNTKSKAHRGWLYKLGLGLRGVQTLGIMNSGWSAKEQPGITMKSLLGVTHV